ncbi:uncharacterized protein MONBRDRAFT_35527 [Monosiga brevicollis MX1]|uniref:Thioredoxin domain-containing protein n=1 Tax=Monosiga brevicollis TaxID=81824 RepID=A9UPR1_MONBE|nr:uncharacterized protein MONBRDRAFT_35527 [Monosiga brevicollis MX1]EDQ92467.1 predicted protein [Monosiga brevicollis MX1]|eukprot:XP_001742229.1 hypothetical protein [Monosiga brevicollis MX1]
MEARSQDAASPIMATEAIGASGGHIAGSCSLGSLPCSPKASILQALRRPKQLFFAVMLLQLSGSMLYTLVNIARGAPPSTLSWIFAFGSTLPITSLIAISTVGRLHAYFGGTAGQNMAVLYFVSMLTSLGAIGTSAVHLRSPSTVALISTLTWATYDQWYSKLDISLAATWLYQHLAPVPEFQIQDLQGQVVRSPQLLSQHPNLPLTLLVFYRGDWCFACMSQLQFFVQRAASLAKAGVMTYFVSSQPLDQRKAVAELLADQPNMAQLYDPNNALAFDWGLLNLDVKPVFLSPQTPVDAAVPTAILINAQHQLVRSWISTDFRSRVLPVDIIEAVKEEAASRTKSGYNEPIGRRATS